MLRRAWFAFMVGMLWLAELLVGLVVLGQEAEGAAAAKAVTSEAARVWQVGSPAATDTVEKLAFTATVGAATSIVLALIEDTGSNQPGTLLAETSAIAFSGKGTYEGTVAATEIKPSVKYWLALIPSGGSVSYHPATTPTWIAFKNSAPAKVTKASSVTSWAEIATETGGPLSIWAIGKEAGGAAPAVLGAPHSLPVPVSDRAFAW